MPRSGNLRLFAALCLGLLALGGSCQMTTAQYPLAPADSAIDPDLAGSWSGYRLEDHRLIHLHVTNTLAGPEVFAAAEGSGERPASWGVLSAATLHSGGNRFVSLKVKIAAANEPLWADHLLLRYQIIDDDTLYLYQMPKDAVPDAVTGLPQREPPAESVTKGPLLTANIVELRNFLANADANTLFPIKYAVFWRRKVFQPPIAGTAP